MQKLKNKNAAILIAAILTISMGASTIFIPTSNAHTPQLQIPTYAYINVAPNPAGVGQTITINFWLGAPPPTASGPYGDRWQNMKITVTKPDGTTETLGPFTSDDTGGTYTTYTPTTTGNYTFSFIFPGQTLAGTNLAPGTVPGVGTAGAFVGDYYQQSSATTKLTVQEESIPYIPSNPLPTGYWERPINAQNNNWYSVGGNWFGFGISSFAASGAYNATTNYNPYTTAPDTPHILWTKPVAFGGTIGGEFGGSLTANYYSTSQYEPKFAPVIINGVLYYTAYPGSNSDPVGINAVDLRSGKTLYTITSPLTTANASTILRCGQVINYVSPNQFGGLAYIWSTGTPFGINAASGTTTYNMFDAMTGKYVLSIVNGTSMVITEDDGGNLIGYYVNASTANKYNAPTLNMWNSTQCIVVGTNGLAAWQWRPTQNAQIDFAKGIMWTQPIATNISGAPFPATLAFSNTIVGPSSIGSGVVELSAFPVAGTLASGGFQAGYEIAAGYDANTGAQLWVTNRTEPISTRISFIGIGYGKYCEVNLETETVNAYNLNTGADAWKTVLPNSNPYNSIGGYMSVLANGVLYLWGFGGDVWALNMADGKILWQTSTTQLIGDPGSDTPYGVWPLWTFTDGTVADGKLYIPMGHEYSPPLFRGAQELCLNITNGELIWSIQGFGVTNPPAIADGIMTLLDAYDNQIYAYGRGPSKTTVTAPDPVGSVGSPIVIRGTITDISAGAEQTAVAKNFPNGLPCVSDASQSGWMQFVYMQQSCPSNITGVPVSIDVIDSNGNYRNIGMATTNADGMFTYTWTPDIQGDYTVFATFAGSGSYFASHADTSFHATAASATIAPTPTPVASMADTYFLPAIIAIIVVMILGFAVLSILTFRKRP
jgi:outer membrane protein assembly factor BamB